ASASRQGRAPPLRKAGIALRGERMSTILARPGELRAFVAELDPGKFRTRIRVILRGQQAGIVQAAGGEIDFLRKRLVLEGKLGSATAAERPYGAGAGCISRRLALREAK